MSVTVVNDWRFLRGADMDEGVAAMREYMSYLVSEDTGLEQSLWLQHREDPERYFHIATYSSARAFEAQLQSQGTKRFVERLGPLIDPDSVVRPVADVVANTGTGPGEI